MVKQSLICIRCPLGCELEAWIKDNKVVNVENYGCKRGIDYAHKELIDPTRTLTTTVPLINGTIRMLPVKTAQDIPKYKLEDCLLILKNITAEAPITLGDIIVKNVADLGVDIVATRSVDEKMKSVGRS